MAFVKSIPLFKDEVIGAQGTAGTVISDVIDLRGCCDRGAGALMYHRAATGGAGGTVGSAIYEYLVCSTRDGTYAAAGTFATSVEAEGSQVQDFTVVPTPFAKIKVVTGTSNPLALTAELNVR